MHYFIDPTKLEDTQNQEQAFGPISSDPENKYNISSTFKIKTGENTKVFACQDAMMIVQPNDGDSTLVNLILKPITGLTIPFERVKYYIYRGVSKSDFIDGSNILPETASNKTAFITQFWTRWNDYKANTGASGNPTPKSFGYDTSGTLLPPTALLEELFNSAESNNTEINDFQAIKVSEGEWIANVLAGQEITFEIITDTDYFETVGMDIKFGLTLEYVRRPIQIIDLSGFPTTTPAEVFRRKAEKEKILNYIDPTAFFGMHFNLGVYSTSSTEPKKKLKKEEVYNTILVKHHNKNRVYLDIRSERGYSYNYYENYGSSDTEPKLIKIKPKEASGFTENTYLTNKWPIFYADNQYTSGVIDLQLRIDDNAQPILFAQNPKLFGDKNTNNFKKEDDILDGTNTEWTKTQKVSMPTYNDGTNDFNIPYHIKLQYFRQEDNTTSPDTVLKANTYLDATFGGIHIPAIDTVTTLFQHVANTKRTFIKGGTFAYVPENGIYQDDNLILFYADNSFSLKSSSNIFPKIDVTKEEQNAIVQSPLLRSNIIYNKWQVNDGTEDIDILEIIGYNSSKKAPTTPIEDLFFLGLTKTEWARLDNLDVSNLHHKYFLFEEIPNQKDAITQTPYKKYKLSVQGLDNIGKVVTKTPTATDEVVVYGSSINMLCSKDFASSTNITRLLPDPGTFTEHEYCQSFRYNENDAFVTNAFPDGSVEVEDDATNQIRIVVGTNLATYQGELSAEVFYPSDDNGDLPSSISSYPLVVITHGNGQRYTEYGQLSRHLAKNGFIVLSISCLGYIKDESNIFLKLPVLEDTLLPHADSFGYSLKVKITKGGVQEDFPDTYVLGIRDNKYIFVYSDEPDPSKQHGSEYQYERITILTCNYTPPSNSSLPAEYEILSAELTSWVKDEDFKIKLNEIQFPNSAPDPKSTLGSLQLSFREIYKTSSIPTNLNLTISTPFPDEHYLILGLGATYIYCNNPTTQHSECEYQKLTLIRFTVQESIPPTPNELVITSYQLLHWVKDVDFKIDIETLTTYVGYGGKIRFLFKYSRQGMGILGRTNMIFAHIKVINQIPMFNGKIADNIGLIGHSRGGEAVVRAAQNIESSIKNKHKQSNLSQVNGVISLAPTDFSKDTITNLTASIPYFVLYGSMDGDVIGYPKIVNNHNRNSGFSLYDRTQNKTEKSMTFIHGATHNGFVTDNRDYKTHRFPPVYGNKLLSTVVQKRTTLAYMNAFCRMTLKGENIWRPIFQGNYIPSSTILKTEQVQQQYQLMENGKFMKVVDFDSGTNIGISDNEVSISPTPISTSYELKEGTLTDANLVDMQTPHDTKGLVFSWATDPARIGPPYSKRLIFHIKSSGLNVTNFNFFSFRIGHVTKYIKTKTIASNSAMYNSSGTGFDGKKVTAELRKKIEQVEAVPTNSIKSLDSLSLKIEDTNGKSYNYTLPTTIIEPDKRENLIANIMWESGNPSILSDDKFKIDIANPTKSAMQTVRVPLSEFNDPVNKVDLEKVKEILIIFPILIDTDKVKVILDTVEFTN